MDFRKIRQDIEVTGFARLHRRLSDDRISRLARLFDECVDPRSAGRRVGPAESEAVLAVLATASYFSDSVIGVMEGNTVAVRVVFFNKSAETDWHVAWHQDTTLAVRSTRDIPPGFGPATFKQGIAHLTAPAEFLSQMLSARIHLDTADETNGALEIIPFSHRKGRLHQLRIHGITVDRPGQVCRAEPGDIHLFRPLLLHRSRRIKGGGRRRVIQIEMAPASLLPAPLEWHAAVPVTKG